MKHGKPKKGKRSDPGKKDREKKAKEHCKKYPGWSSEEICLYLKELHLWSEALIADYTKVRIALCNLESEFYDQVGNANKRFCKGGPGGDPTPPAEPPKWG